MKYQYAKLKLSAEDSVQHLFEAIRQLRIHTNLDIYIRDFYNQDEFGYEVDLRVADDRTAPVLFLSLNKIEQLGMVSDIDDVGYPIITKGNAEILFMLKSEPDKSADKQEPKKSKKKKAS